MLASPLFSFQNRHWHHQAGVNFERFTEAKFRVVLLTGTGV